MNGIDVILADHRRVDALFDSFAETADGTLIGQLVDALTAHDEAEHAALYPLAAKLLDDPEMIQRAEIAHSHVKKLIEVLKFQEAQPLTDTVALLRTAVAEHVADEETNLLPALADKATPQQLEGLAARIEQNKQRVG